MTAMLNVKDLRAYYGQVQALHGLSFSLNEGSLTTLLGANGAGKTTTLARHLQHGALDRRDRVRGQSRSAAARPKTSCGSASRMCRRAAAPSPP